MSGANEHQVGGEHYKSKYQHWDFVCDTNLHYLLGCATKYVTRWRKKNGLQDLEKTAHYIQKAKERDIKGLETMEQKQHLLTFISGLETSLEKLTIEAISVADWPKAEESLSMLMEEAMKEVA